MMEKSKLKKKSKCLKKPLQLKNTISQSLAHNTHTDSFLKKETSMKPSIYKTKPPPQPKDFKLQNLYNQVEVRHKGDSDSDNSEDMLLADLEKKDDDDSRKGKRNKKSILFSHLFRDSGNITRKLSVLQEKINQNIQKNSVQSKIKEMSGKQTPNHKRSSSLLPKNLERNVAKLNEQGATEVRLANMQLAHYSLTHVKQQLSHSGKLKVLDLSYNSLTNKSIPLLAEILTQNVIEQLSVKWNQLTYQGGMQLMEAITYNINLSSLDISYNKLTNNSPAFIEACLKMLTENRFLTHLNLEMCHLTEQNCSAFAKTFNLINQTIIALHFKGNGRYYANKLGYITKHATRDDLTAFPPSRELIRHPQNEPLHNLCSRYLMGEDCCWLCQRWVSESFRFPQEVPPVSLNSREIDEYFLHLSCYDYQPIRLSIEECVSTTQGKRECKRLEWSNYEIHLAQVPVPSTKDVTYFFTLNGKPLVNQDEPILEICQLVQFEVFDVFEQLYQTPRDREKYNVLVRKMNKRSKEDFSFNKSKKLKGDITQYNYKQAFRSENRKMLKSIAIKSKKSSVHSIQGFDQLPKIGKSQPISPRKSKVASTEDLPNEDVIVAVNVRKCKQKPFPAPEKTQKHLSLGITPRNKDFLFNYHYFEKSGFEIEDVAAHQDQFRKVQRAYFGSFHPSYMTKFFRQRYQVVPVDHFMDRFKILTRKYFNSNEMLFSDIFNFLYSNFISLNSKCSKQGKNAADRSKNHKTVKFGPTVNNQTKISILVNSEKHVDGKTAVELSTSAHQKTVQRRALSMNCINDNYKLSKLKAMPAGSIHTLQSNILSTDKSIKSIKDIPLDPTLSLLQLSLDSLPHPIDLTDDVYGRYSTLSTQYGWQKKTILDMINGYDRSCQKEKLKQINQIIVTFNYYKLTHHYELTILKGIQRLLANFDSFNSLHTFLPKAITKHPDSGIPSFISQQGLDLQGLEQYVTNQSAQESFLSFSEFLSNQGHPARLLKRGDAPMIKSSKKRKGKYGRSLKNIKEELMGEHSKVVLPADSDQLLQQIEQQELNEIYNQLVRHLNIISEVILQVLDHIIAKYLNTHNCGDEKGLIDQWLHAQLSARIATFISQVLQESRNGKQMGRVRERSAQICQFFVLNSFVELMRASVMLRSSFLQQNFKEYQFISPFHSYQFIIGVQITKLTHIVRALNDPDTFRTHISDLLLVLAEIWTQYQLQLIHGEKAKRQEQAARRKKRHKTNGSIDRSIPSDSIQ